MNILQFKKANCKNCYKCVRNCAVKAIEISNHQAKIVEKDCILCGTCTLVCPQNAKEDKNDVILVQKAIYDKKQVIVSVAPSYAAYYHLTELQPFEDALLQLGFAKVEETALGAKLVKSEYERLITEHQQDVIISSSCPTINNYIRKYCPDVLINLAPVLTPMQAHGKYIKEHNSDAVVVFIGPCISKKGECQEEDSFVDYVLTFEEVKDWLDEANIEIEKGTNENSIENIPNTDRKKSRFFPTSGGILKTMEKQSDVMYVSVDGIENCINAIKEIKEHKLGHTFVEMSACVGSCIGGPSFRKKDFSILRSSSYVSKTADETDKDFTINDMISIHHSFASEYVAKVMPSEGKIIDILKKMGKTCKEDELNCGMCGYSSCREKAIAVYFNKAETSMCLPFMKERAESFSDQIINVTPNAILTVDLDLNVLQLNDAAKRLFHIQDLHDIINSPVSRILDEFDFVNMIVNDTRNVKKRAFLTEYNVYLDQVFYYDKANSIIICIMKDITEEKRQKNEVMKARRVAANMADDIMEKQLRIVHEIASLLGETAAETKIAISDLKETILMDEEDR